MKKVRSGDPLNIPAAAYNAFIDAAEAEKMRRLNGGTGASTAKSTPTIHIQNSSGGDLEAFNVLGIEGPLIPPTDNENQFKFNLALDGTTPTTADHLGKFAVLSEPIADGKIGRAYVSGVFPALVTIDDEDHTRADVDDGETTALISSNSGAALILWKAGATSAGGPRWCVLRMDGMEACDEGDDPPTLGDGFEDSIDPATDTWDRDPAAGATYSGAIIYNGPRVRYDVAGISGDYNIYEYPRPEHIDACGKRKSIGAETRVVVAETTECVEEV